MRTARVWTSLSFLLISILACNMPGSQTNDLAATITAQAIALQNSAASPTPASVPVTGGTPSAAEVSVTSATNCRTGPSTAYDLVFSANPGQSFQVVGKDTPDDYWIINNPAGGTCWLWGHYAVVTGNTATLPDFPPPAPPPPPQPKPSKTPKPTAADTATATATTGSVGPIFPPVKPIVTLILLLPTTPGNFTQNRSCGAYFDGLIPKWAEDVNLTWQASSNQSGYRIYKNGSAIGTLPANSTSFHIQLRYDQGTGGPLFDNFGVEAFNGGLTSSRPSLDVPRCP